ncbi:MAG: NAD-dependent DNA ligase LigA, partial [Acidobacteriota bacterium]
MDDRKERAAARMKELAQLITKHRRLYYEQDAPEISDYEYDLLEKELSALEVLHPDLSLEDSPLLRVGGKPGRTFSPVPHRSPLLSLDNSFSEEDVLAWVARTEKILERRDPSFVGELKLDGLSVALTYRRGVLVQAATRGNGAVGEEVTDNIRTIRQIPGRIDSELPELVVRGEVYMELQAFV